MKIESVKINFAVADRISRKTILEMMSEMVLTPESNELGLYGIEIEDDGRGTAASAADVPRKKRKYTRRAKPAEGDDKCAAARGRVQPAGAVVKDGVVRVKRDDGTTIERRGNCQGGNAS